MLLWTVIGLYHYSTALCVPLLSVGTHRPHVYAYYVQTLSVCFGCGWATNVHCVFWLVWAKAMAANIVVHSDGCA